MYGQWPHNESPQFLLGSHNGMTKLFAAQDMYEHI